MGPLTEAIASRTTVVEGRLVRLSQRDHRTALSANHSSIGLEGVSGQRRRSKWCLRPGQCLALPDLLPHELSRGQAAGLYQRSTGLRSMAHPKWLTAISFNLHRLQLFEGMKGHWFCTSIAGEFADNLNSTKSNIFQHGFNTGGIKSPPIRRIVAEF